MKKAMKEWKSFLHSPFYFNTLKKVFSENFTFSFHIFESRVIYIVEGHEKPAVLTETAPNISELRIRNDSTERRSQKWYRFSPSPFPENGQNQCKLKKSREIQDFKHLSRQKWRETLFRRKPSHFVQQRLLTESDTELIGHRGWEVTGFLCAG